MTASDLDHMFCNDGAYVLSDPRFPGATSIVVVMGARHNDAGWCIEEGRMFMLEPKYELSKNPEKWRDLAVHLMGGPFTVQTIELAKKEMDLMDTELDFLSYLAERCRPMIPAYHELMKGIGRQQEAVEAQKVMEDIDAVLEARRRCQEVFNQQIPKA